MQKLTIYIIFFSLTIFLQTSCRQPGKTVHVNLTDFSVEDQYKIGEAVNSEILSNPNKYAILDKNEYGNAYQYLNTLLRTLLTTESVKRRDLLDWELHILKDDNQKNIFSAPGGKIYIYTGFLKFIKTESEFFSVIANEIYFSDSDISINRISEQVTDAGFILGDIILENNNTGLEELVCALPNILFSEADITNADEFAIEVICNFQYDAFGLKNLLIQADAANNMVEWTNTRPVTEQRLQNIMDKASICGSEEAFFEERYQRFLAEYLP